MQSLPCKRVHAPTATVNAKRAPPIQARTVASMPAGLHYAAGVMQRGHAAGAGQALPFGLRAGIESLSGMDMSHVRVHYASPLPAQVNALAYAQGAHIHLAGGEEKHLPHEAWHVVQQRQGRVRETMQMAGMGVNDDVGLEREADAMGRRAALQGRAAGAAQALGTDQPARGEAPSWACSTVAQGHAHAVVQRQIGAGGMLLEGRLVVDAAGTKYEIVGQQTFLGHLEYELQTAGGSSFFVRADDDNFHLYQGYEGVLGFDGREQERTPIEFTISRRDNGPRTNTVFSDPTRAKQILVTQCDVPQQMADTLIDKADWSYPMVRSLMALLSKDGTLQPGLDEGARLWQEAQPEKVYTIQTTGVGSQLAQLVGCHLMEYQETNNGTQGPRQSKEESRKNQLKLTRAILSLPEDQVAKHAIGLEQPPFVNQFPAPFDIKFDGGPLFGRNAGTSTFKVYQSAIKKRSLDFDHRDTLQDAARKNRKTAMKSALADTKFNVDTMALLQPDEDFLRSQYGLKDTESDNSMDEDEGWESPLTKEAIGTWTLEQFHEFLFKHNVHSGVLFKEYASKQAELDILAMQPPQRYDSGKLSASRNRRGRVQSRVKRANDALLSVMRSLGINVTFVYTRLKQWQDKSNLLKSKNSTKANEYKQALQQYGQKSLLTLQQEGYPPPLEGVADKTIEQC